jgi:subtilisin family serine protease
VQDGRVKPEISAFGSSVFSTYPNNAYATISGTSMATPGIAGSVTLLVQRYKQLNANALPPSTLIKNTILNTAHDLGNPGPDYRFGYGRINALEAVKILETNRYVLSTITTGATNDMNITVPAGAARLRVMLTWNDPAGAANANPGPG